MDYIPDVNCDIVKFIAPEPNIDISWDDSTYEYMADFVIPYDEQISQQEEYEKAQKEYEKTPEQKKQDGVIEENINADSYNHITEGYFYHGMTGEETLSYRILEKHNFVEDKWDTDPSEEDYYRVNSKTCTDCGYHYVYVQMYEKEIIPGV